MCARYSDRQATCSHEAAPRGVLSIGALALAIVCATARPAAADSALEYPSQGSEPLGRGGAWVARATDPIALTRNPAGLVAQPARISAGWDLPIRRTCFTRTKALNDQTLDGTAPGATYPRVCDDAASLPVGFLAFAYPATPRFSISAGLVTPSGVPQASFPMFEAGRPAPQRYLLLESTALFSIPTIGAAWEAIPNLLRIGASFGWGLAWVRTSAAAPAFGDGALRPEENDIKVKVTAADLFVPRATFGLHSSPSEYTELGGSIMVSAPIEARGDARTEANAFSERAATGDTSRVAHGDTSVRDCGRPGTEACGAGDNAALSIPIPIVASAGARFRRPRRGRAAGDGAKRDPLEDEVFDIEVDLTYAQNSSLDRYALRFPEKNGTGTIPVAGTAGVLPPVADVERRHRDVIGARIGSDLNVVPGRLALRTGAFIEPRSAIPGHVGLETMSGRRIGVSLGATARFPITRASKSTDKPEHTSAFDLSVAWLHVFIDDVSSEDPAADGVRAVTGAPPHRTAYPVGLGRIENALDVVHLGAAYRF